MKCAAALITGLWVASSNPSAAVFVSKQGEAGKTSPTEVEHASHSHMINEEHGHGDHHHHRHHRHHHESHMLNAKTTHLHQELPAHRHLAAKGDVLQGKAALTPRETQREIERMAVRADRLAATDRKASSSMDAALEELEAALQARAGDDTVLTKEISGVRADLCTKAGFDSPQRSECEDFMRKACGSAAEQTDKAKESTVSLELCQHFFAQAHDETRHVRAGSAPAPADKEDAADDSVVGPAPAPCAGSAQAPAASPPAEWFTKTHRALPEQGYSGDMVKHGDTESQTSDWQREFGPRSGHRGYREICKDHPNNRWCQLHMSYRGADQGAGWARQGRHESYDDGEDGGSGYGGEGDVHSFARSSLPAASWTLAVVALTSWGLSL